MVKFIIRILFFCVISVSLNLIYQVFFTHEKFNGNPVLFFPHINYPIFVILTFVSTFVFEKYIMKSKFFWALVFAFIVTLSFIFLAKSIEHKYGYVYEHYYQRTPFTNLTHLKEYRNQIDNRLTLGKALKDEGLKIKSIEGGYTEKGHLASSSKDYHKKVYYVNDDLYIIFDWDKEKITAQANKRKMLQLLHEKYDNINEDMHSDTFYSKFGIGLLNEKKYILNNYSIAPTEDGMFKFIED